MRRLLAVPLWLALTLSLCAAPLELPTEVKGDVGAFVKVPATTQGKQVRWVSLDSGLNVFPVDLLKDSRTCVVTAQQPGRYRLLAYSAIDGEPTDPAICVVVIGTPPDPGPGPNPPDPPPDDVLVKSLKAAYAQESDPQKAEHVKRLAALYRMGAEAAQDRRLGSWGALFTMMSEAASTLGVAGKVPAVQAAVAAELKRTIPSSPSQTLDDIGRAKAKSEFLRIAAALEATLK